MSLLQCRHLTKHGQVAAAAGTVTHSFPAGTSGTVGSGARQRDRGCGRAGHYCGTAQESGTLLLGGMARLLMFVLSALLTGSAALEVTDYVPHSPITTVTTTEQDFDEPPK